MTKRKIGSVSFVVYGSAIVENARSVALSGEWMKAMNLLREQVIGFTLDHAMTVLSGEMTLIGNSQDDNIELVEDENSQDYKREMREVYLTDLFYEDGQLYKLNRIISDNEIRKLMDQMEVYFDAHYPPEQQIAFIKKHKVRDGEIIHRIHSMEYVISNKVDPNCYPMWFNRSDYYNSHIECYNAYRGIKKPEIVISKPPMPKENKKNENNYIDEIIKNNNEAYLEESAKHYQYDNKKVMSDKLKQRVMEKCEQENVTWEKVETEDLQGNKVFLDVPKEIVLGYLSKDSRVWSPVCPSGLKMMNDSPWHSDLWLAMGNDLSSDAYDHKNETTKMFYDAIDHYRFQKINEIADFALLNDVKLKQFEGRVVFEDSKNITDRDILVLPNAGLKYERIARKAGMVICETGGQLSHLSIVGKEEMFPVVIMKDAIRKLASQYSISVDFEKNKVIGTYN